MPTSARSPAQRIVMIGILVAILAGCRPVVTEAPRQSGSNNPPSFYPINWKFNSAIWEDEKTWHSLTVLGDIYTRAHFRPHFVPPREVFEQELAQLDKELVTRPDDPWLLWWRAVPLVGLGRDAEAFETRQMAIAAAAARSDMVDTEAWFYFAEAHVSGLRGNVKCAALNYMRSIERSPRCADRFDYISFPNAATKETLKFPDTCQIPPELAQRWGDSDSFFTRFPRPLTVRELQANSVNVIPGISYLEIPKIIGFPNWVRAEKLALGQTQYRWTYSVNDPVTEPPPPNTNYRLNSDGSKRYRPEEFFIIIAGGKVERTFWKNAF